MALSGCGSPTPEPRDEGSNHLMDISQAYLRYTTDRGQPPQSAEDIQPLLPADSTTTDYYRSTRDGEPFVILWGTDPRAGMDIKPLVIGYEQQGKDGMRYVFTAMGVMMMDEEGFADARFPPNHQPPQ